MVEIKLISEVNFDQEINYDYKMNIKLLSERKV